MFIYALTPLVGMSFPALTPLIFATAGALGYKAVVDMKEGGDINKELQQRIHDSTTVEARLNDTVLDSMSDEVRRGESLFFEKDGVTIAVVKDERGKLGIHVTGPKDADKRALREMGREFAEELSQMFAQNRVTEEMEKLNAEVTEEEVNEEGERILRVSRWT